MSRIKNRLDNLPSELQDKISVLANVLPQFEDDNSPHLAGKLVYDYTDMYNLMSFNKDTKKETDAAILKFKIDNIIPINMEITKVRDLLNNLINHYLENESSKEEVKQHTMEDKIPELIKKINLLIDKLLKEHNIKLTNYLLTIKNTDDEDLLKENVSEEWGINDLIDKFNSLKYGITLDKIEYDNLKAMGLKRRKSKRRKSKRRKSKKSRKSKRRKSKRRKSKRRKSKRRKI